MGHVTLTGPLLWLRQRATPQAELKHLLSDAVVVEVVSSSPGAPPAAFAVNLSATVQCHVSAW